VRCAMGGHQSDALASSQQGLCAQERMASELLARNSTMKALVSTV
jgi:hypothetical protein